jgi:hypothetical protein
MFSVFPLFRYYLPLERGNPLPLNKLESHTSKDDMCQIWFKLARWLWRRRFLNDPTSFLHFCDYLRFEEDLALYLNKLKFPSPRDIFVPSLIDFRSAGYGDFFFKFQCIFTLSPFISPLGKRLSASFEQT